jgi:hypothetical protein
VWSNTNNGALFVAPANERVYVSAPVTVFGLTK